MSIASLITRLHALGVRLHLEHGELSVKAPKGVLTSELLQELKTEKAEIIEFLRAAGGSGKASTARIERAREGSIRVPSFAQQRLWFLDQLDPGTSVYNIPFVLRLRGALNVVALEAAFNDLIARHEALRSRFDASQSEDPLLLVDAALQLSIDRIELPAASNSDIQEKLEALNTRGFDLATGPLIRMHLLTVSDDDHVLMLMMHHIISDAWSLNIISQELIACYQARCEGTVATLPELPLQFSDYSWWQRQWLTDTELKTQLDFWRKTLAGAPEVLELPADRTRPARPTNRGGRVQQRFPKALTDKLKELAKQENSTLFMVLLAACDLLLSRYSGQEDIVVGTPIAGRDRTELEGLVGFFINNLVLRTDLSGNPSFRGLVGRARDTALDAYAHQSLPFEKLVEELQPARNMSHTPIYQVLFMLQNAPLDSGGFADLATEGLGFDYGTAKFDLTVATIENTDGLAAEFEYNKDIFDHATIERMVEHFGLLLEGITANPDLPIGQYELLSKAEQQKILIEWNDTGFAYPAAGTMHSLFEQQVALTPDAVAIYCDGREISYVQLNRNANRLAHRLIELGISTEALVAVCSERRIEMLTGMLAILKAGGAYVPVDPDYPPDRVAYMLQDSQASVVLTSNNVRDKLPETSAQILILDEFGFDDTTLADTNPAVTVLPAQLGYTIYTSGSTGLPKGVEIEHRNAVALIEWMRDIFTPAQMAGVLASTSICFDLSVFEIFGTLGLGGRIVLVPDALALPALPPAANVTLINTVPSAIAELVRVNGLPTSLKTVNLAGEPLSTLLVNEIYATGTVEAVNDLYGPSEDTTYSTWTRREANQRATIGRPLHNTQAYVLDKHKRPVPVGVAGELYLAGAGVTRGYRNQPELTREKYLPNPFSTEPDARMYGTGDLVRYRPDGNLEYIGRIDHQIKLRGFRIELGEIETALVEHPAISKAVVIIREDQPGDKRLVGYAVTEGLIDSAELHAMLAETLPAYMVPSAFVLLPELPLTPNGKLDRKALPVPQWTSSQEYVAPRNQLEMALAGIFADLLGMTEPGIHDDFFELGGHSLLAARAIGRIRRNLGLSVALTSLFNFPTIAGLAQELNRQSGTPATVPVEASGVTTHAPLSWSQERLWFLDEFDPGSPAYNIPWAVRLKGTLKLPALQKALSALVERHIALRTVFTATDDGPVQDVLDSIMVKPRVISGKNLSPDQLQLRLRHLSQEGFDLKRGPLLRVHVIHMAAEENVLLLTLHHIIADNWSIGVLQKELSALYNAAVTNATVSLPAPALNYIDYAVWQRQTLNDGALQEQLDYWKEQLAGAPALVELPTDKPRPTVRTFNGSGESLMLDADLSAALHKLANGEQCTLFMVLLAGFSMLLGRYSTSDDIVIGTPISGRSDPGLEDIVGIFLNTLVLRCDLSDNPSFRELLKKTRGNILDAYQHQDLPFERLVEQLQPGRNLSHSPIFQVMFTLNAGEPTPFEFDGLTTSAIGFDYGTAKFDLNLSMTDTGQGLGAFIEYNTDLFSRSTIQRMLGHYARLLAALSEQPSLGINQLAMLDVAERQSLLEDPNQKLEVYAGPETLHGLIDARMAACPAAIAIIDEQRQLSYQQVDSESTALAAELIAHGAGPGVPVAVCLERSATMVISLLAVLRSGSYYVPLDPNYPSDRIHFMLEDSGAKLLVTETALCERLPTEGRIVLCADQPREMANVDLKNRSGPDDLAYQIYTSGSTGQPKGVQIEHRAIVNFQQNMATKPGFEANDTLLSVTTLCFDISLLEFFLPLIVGGKVVIAKQADTADGFALQQLIATHNITIMQATPATWRIMLQSGWTGTPGLRLLCGGEALDRGLANQLIAGNAEVWNMYGPTETTVWSTCHRYATDDPVISVGKQISNMLFYVLDDGMEPTPLGVPGELYIGGVGVGRGYANRDELNATVFLQNPFAAGRIYKSGDRVRWLKDGSLEVLGRIDFQVKLRGFRIELGEIEAALVSHPAVTQAVVILREDNPGDQRLVAYLLARDGVSLDPTDLREHIQNGLPDYMLPSAYVQLEQFPLTPNLKVNRKALPAPEQEQLTTTEYMAPRNATETALCDIWAEVLNVATIGIKDDFFALGGHSLLATRLIAMVRKRFETAVALQALFEHPTVEGLAFAIDDNDGVAEAAIEILPRRGELPLSYAQQRLWFLDQLDPDSPMYNIPWAIQLRGLLDKDALQVAVNAIVARHEVLRSRFRNTNGNATLTIEDDLSLDIEWEPVVAENLQARVTELAEQPIDLGVAPLMRVHVLQESPDRCVLLVVIHHIIADGISLNNLFAELSAGYRGKQELLPALPVQYVDYAAWQQQQLTTVGEQQLNYWRESLANAPSLLELPTDRPRPAKQTFAGRLAGRLMNDATAKEVRKLAKRSGTTLFMTMLAGFDALLARYSGQTDIVVGTPVTSRSRSELEPLIGMFLNTLPLRADLSTNPSFDELLQQVRTNTLGAYANQDVPFEQLVEKLQPVRDMSFSPIFQVMFTLQTGSTTLPEFADGISTDVFGFNYQSAKFDISVSVTDLENGAIGLTFEYNTDLFDQSTIERMLLHYENVLSAIVVRHDEPLATLPLLGADEQQQLLHDWNATAAALPAEPTLHQYIEAQMQRAPQALAVVSGDRQLTYRELDELTAALAIKLQALGAGADVPIAVCLERSVDMLVGMLAILRSGSGYVPLDPNYPQDRIDYMLRDSGAQILVTESALVSRLPIDHVTVVNVDEVAVVDSDATLSIQNNTHSLAYQIYTSGSTGLPKGVQIEHQAVLNFLSTMNAKPGMAAGDKLLAVTTLCFDISILELFQPLTVGAAVVIASHEATSDGAALATLLDTHSITVMQATPATWRMLLQSGWQGSNTLKVLCGGEALDRELADQLVSRNAELWNMYGPTETTIWSTCHRYKPSDAVITVGKPIANTLIYVLDNALLPVPAGMPGELYIGGTGVARGYWQRAELNSERFLANPFAKGRIYRTGDRVRWLADGTLEVLGRTDFQVKLRGFRIELGEIETALASYADVTQAVVTLREDRPGDQRLVAYLIAPDGVTLDPAELRSHISVGLPEYMLPAAYVQLERFPLTPNGKIDRKSLPAPDAAQVAKVEYVAPRNPTEAALCELWHAVLGVDNIGIHDDFFALGGHSLIATQLVSRIRDTLNAELPLRQLFEQPTVAELAVCISGDAVPAIEIPRIDRSGPLLLSSAQQRLWFLDQLEPGNPVYNIPWSIRLRGELNVSALQAAIDDMVERHEMLRTTFESDNEGPTQLIHDSMTIPLEQAAAADEAAMQQLLAAFSAKSFDLNSGPLLYTQLIECAPDHHVLTLVLHHIIADGWSWNVLFRELMSFYNARINGEKAPLPELAVQYVDYCAYEHALLQGAELQRQTDYWVGQLQGAPALLELPTDYPRPPVQSYNGAHLTRHSAVGLNTKLTRIANAQGCTPYMLLFAAFNLLLARFAGQDDIVVGTPIAGRQRTEFEALIGLFLNTLAIRTDLSGNPSFDELLARVKQNSLEAYGHQDLPFEKLVEVLQPTRDQSHTPLFQVMFNYHNEPQQEITYPGLSAEIIVPERASAKFDLSVAMADVGDRFWIDFEYNTDLFSPATIDLMLSCLNDLLADIAAAPDAPLSSYQLRLPATPPVDWHGRAESNIAFAVGNLAAQFELQAAATPAALAVDDGKLACTYAQLNNQANAIATQLGETRPGASRVALLLGHDATMVAGLLGTLKTGAHYLPLDPLQPEPRLQQLIDLGQPDLLLTDAAHQELAEQFSGITVVCIDEVTSDKLYSNPEITISPETTAYILFTSGSTGTPKGVIQTHGHVLSHVAAYANALRLDAADRLSLFSNYSFDASIQDIFGAILVGASVHPIDLRNAEQSSDVVAPLIDRNISVFHATPTVFRNLLGERDKTLAAARLAVLGGEIARDKDFALFKDVFPATAVFCNGYGLTESTINLQYFADQTSTVTGKFLPAGLPVKGSAVELIDRRGAVSSICGEITLLSDRLFTGYLGAAARNEPQCYATGDEARYQADGEIVIVGRKDQQIKIRGYRLNLIEVEQLIAGNSRVKRAAALVQGQQTDDPYLVCFIESSDGELDVDALRSELRQTVPSFMLPSALVPIAAIPMTSNGKIDRKALPVYDPQQIARGIDAQPTTDNEKRLHQIWCQLLKLDTIGINDNFFDLGGHSLTASRLVSRVRDTFNTNLPLRSLFDEPTIAGLASLLDAAVDTTGSQQLMIPVGRDTPTQASFGQERLWFIDRMLPGGRSYNIPWAIRISGDLNKTALKIAIDKLVARHESLRTTFTELDGTLVQIIAPALHIALKTIDVAGANDALLVDTVSELAQRPFNIERGPLFAAHLLYVADNNYVLVLNVHHIIADAWSINILNRDLQQLYNGLVLKQPAQLPELNIQYADYSVWLRKHLSQEEVANQVDYWRNQLQSAPRQLELPTDRPRPLVQTYNGAAHGWAIEGDTGERLRQLARRSGTTLYMVLLAAFKVLLYRHTRQTDIVVGSPVSGRSDSRVEELVGFFVNMLALRSQINPEASFVDLLEPVRNTVLDAFAHQDIPFEKLVEELNPERNRSHSPIFQVSFVLQNTPSEVETFCGLAASNFQFGRSSSKFDLNLAMWEEPSILGGVIEFNTDLFDQATAERFAEHYKILLKSIAEDPDQRIDSLALLSAQEQALVTYGWNNTVRDYPAELSIAEVFESMAARTPDATALRCKEQRLNYRELNERANQLAQVLRNDGIGPESMVALCLDRGIDALVTILAILKAGGAYVPLDPSYPSERLQFILTDTQAAVLVSNSDITIDVELGDCNRIDLNTLGAHLQMQSTKNLPQLANGQNLAYVIYTSGSTGVPKGVLIEQRSVLRLVINNPYTELNTNTRIGMLATISFDASTYEIWGALLNGGECIIFPERVPTIDKLAKFLESSKSNAVFLTTSLFNTIVDANVGVLRNLDEILTGGEAISVDHVKRAVKALPNTKLIHVYGPTESTTFATAQAIVAPLAANAGSLTIGGPIANTTCYVLDEKMQAVPIGVAGELYIGGDGVAREYLNRPELTAERFVKDPFNATTNSRLYKTGDIVRWLPNGKIDFVGRADNQVKLRGYRIELGEIETALRNHPQISNAAVIIKEYSVTDKRLIAYVVTEGEVAELAYTLREFLSGSLPTYMVPSLFVELEEIPLTINGKLDRKALPEIRNTTTESQASEQPQNETQRKLHTIWRRLLQNNEIGIYDNFFDLGGHSLLTIQLIKLINEKTGVQLQIADVFEQPTIAGLEKLIAGETSTLFRPQALIRLKPQGDYPPIFLLQMTSLNIGRRLHTERAVFEIDLTYFSGELPDSSIQILAATYLADMQSIQANGPYTIAAHGIGCVIACEMLQQLTMLGKTVSHLSLIAPPPLVTRKRKDRSENILEPVYSAKVSRLHSTLCKWYALCGGRPPGYLRQFWRLITADKMISAYNPVEIPEAVIRDTRIDVYFSGGEESAPKQAEGWKNAFQQQLTVHKIGTAVEALDGSISGHTDDLITALEQVWQLETKGHKIPNGAD